MTYREIMLIFKAMFPGYESGISDYRPQDGQINSIHIWMLDGRELVFTFNNDSDWYFETYEHFKNKIAMQSQDLK